MRSRKWVVNVGALLATFVVSLSAQATAYLTPRVGGTGGTDYSVDCGDTGVLVGLQSRWGSWLDQLTPVCSRISPTTGDLGPAFTSTRIGGTGGTTVGEVRCGPGHVVVAATVNWGWYVNGFAWLRCAPWNAASKSRGAADSSTRRLGASGGTITNINCPSDQAVMGLRGKASKYVDSLSFVCNVWNR